MKANAGTPDPGHPPIDQSVPGFVGVLYPTLESSSQYTRYYKIISAYRTVGYSVVAQLEDLRETRLNRVANSEELLEGSNGIEFVRMTPSDSIPKVCADG